MRDRPFRLLAMPRLLQAIFANNAGLRSISAIACVLGAASTPRTAVADEGGVGLWVPGFFGSLAATPQEVGFSYADIYYHTSVAAGGSVAFARQVSRGNITANLTGTVNANLNAVVDLNFAVPSYVFKTPVLGGQAAVAMAIPYGRARGSVDATVTGALGPIRSHCQARRRTRSRGSETWVPCFRCAGMRVSTIG
jgi:hypothetical protein